MSSSEMLPWMMLAAAIVKSGKEDEAFQKSDWCAFLKESVADYVEDRNRAKGRFTAHTVPKGTSGGRNG